jgi:multidrug efflux system membrane fusion protein
MSSFFTLHRTLALIVLIIAAAWVLTGKFAAVGSEIEHAAEEKAAKDAATPAEVAKRTVAVVRADVVNYTREIRISGVTEADKLAVLAARSSGIVKSLGVAPGQMVASGATVLQLDGDEQSAGVKTAEDQLTQAAQRLEVGEALFAKGSLAELEITSRRAAKSAAEAGLSQAKAAADRLSLTAPFAGSVDAVNVEIGEWVQAGTPIATLISLDPIVVKAEVSERDVANVALGAKARVKLVSGVEMAGIVRHVAKQASDKTRTFAIEVALPNGDGAIPSGMTAEVRLSAAPQMAVAVPRSIITISDAGLIGLRVVGDDNRAAFVPGEIIDDSEAGLVLSGIPQGARVIVAGQDLVRDGDEVIVHEMTAAEAEAAAGVPQP